MTNVLVQYTLLQAFIGLLPMIAFQIWYDRPERNRGISVFIAVLSGIAMVGCMLLSQSFGNGLDIDNRTAPYLIGSLYGGYMAAGALSLLYVAMRIPYMDGMWEWIGLGLFAFIFVPVLLILIRMFRKAESSRRKQIALLTQCLMLLIFAISVVIHPDPLSSDKATFVLLVIFYTICLLVIMWASVKLIEGAKEKLAMHSKLQQMSVNYRNEEQKLQQFIDVTPLGVIIVSREGIITNINDYAVRYSRNKNTIIDRLSLIGRPYTDLDDGTLNDVNVRLIRKALDGEAVQREIVRENQKIFIKTGFSVRDRRTNEILAAAIIAHDITEVTRLKDEINRVERLSLVGQMAASITHEIRNPMAVIRGFVQLMMERGENQRQEYYQIIIEELDRTNGIINDFLSLAQNRIVNKEVQSLNGIIRDLHPLVMADANLRGQSVELHLCEEEPMLEMNDKEIKQLILNLARNGMESMGEKGTLTIQTLCLEGRVELRVIDQGTGIPKEEIDRLFEPFYTTKTRGTGLGLPLCLSIAEQHNGTIDIESEEGTGTTIIITFNV